MKYIAKIIEHDSKDYVTILNENYKFLGFGLHGQAHKITEFADMSKHKYAFFRFYDANYIKNTYLLTIYPLVKSINFKHSSEPHQIINIPKQLSFIKDYYPITQFVVSRFFEDITEEYSTVYYNDGDVITFPYNNKHHDINGDYITYEEFEEKTIPSNSFDELMRHEKITKTNYKIKTFVLYHQQSDKKKLYTLIVNPDYLDSLVPLRKD